MEILLWVGDGGKRSFKSLNYCDSIPSVIACRFPFLNPLQNYLRICCKFPLFIVKYQRVKGSFSLLFEKYFYWGVFKNDVHFSRWISDGQPFIPWHTLIRPIITLLESSHCMGWIKKLFEGGWIFLFEWENLEGELRLISLKNPRK